MTISYSVSTKLLLRAITAVSAVVPHKPSRDILKCLKVKAEIGISGGCDIITLFATDLETYATFTISENVVVLTPGEFVVPAQTLFDYIKNLEDDTINMSVEDEALKISESGTELVVGLQDIQEFPEFPIIPVTKTDWITLSLEAIKHSLSQVVFAVAEKGHPRWGSLSSICINLSKEVINLAGTDQKRASLVEFPIAAQTLEGQYLVTATALELVTKLFDVDFQMTPNTPNNLIFKNSECVLFVRLVAGDFPSFSKILPKHPNQVALSVPELTRQVKKAALAADQHDTLKMEIKNDKLCLSAKTREQRKGVKIEKALVYAGSEIQFAINCKYLLDLLKASKDDEDLMLHFNKNNQPLLFTQTNFKHLMMPQETR
jgi:DNA polymerase III beta subunit